MDIEKIDTNYYTFLDQVKSILIEGRKQAGEILMKAK